MTDACELTGLDGTNPLGFLAALGTLVVCDRMTPDAEPRMSWTTEVVPRPVLHGAGEVDQVIDAVLADRDEWRSSPALEFQVDGFAARDVKFTPEQVRGYLDAASCADDGGRSRDLAAALVAEFSLDQSGHVAKPTDLHFTTANQHFLVMSRELRDGVTSDDLVEALVGPWRYQSKMPSLKWDVSDDRVYALGATNPSKSKKLTVPGAEWLALMGLTVLPVAVDKRGRTVTSGCAGSWKRGTFTWAFWDDPVANPAISALMGQRWSADEQRGELARRGVFRIMQSRITRSDQGGYGSFRPPRVLWDRSQVALAVASP